MYNQGTADDLALVSLRVNWAAFAAGVFPSAKKLWDCQGQVEHWW
jgi:hypothetical protein